MSVSVCVHVCKWADSGWENPVCAPVSTPEEQLRSICIIITPSFAGSILEGLTAPPLNHSFEALASHALAVGVQPGCRSLQQQADAQNSGNAIGTPVTSSHTVQDLAEAARHSRSARVLAQFRAWESKQGSAGPCQAGSVPGAADEAHTSISGIEAARWRARGAATLMGHGAQTGRAAASHKEYAAGMGDYRAWVTAKVGAASSLFLLFGKTSNLVCC